MSALDQQTHVELTWTDSRGDPCTKLLPIGDRCPHCRCVENRELGDTDSVRFDAVECALCEHWYAWQLPWALLGDTARPVAPPTRAASLLVRLRGAFVGAVAGWRDP